MDGFATLFEFLPIGAYRSSPEGRMLRANPALVRLNGCDSEAELLERVRDIATEWYVDPERRETFKRLLDEHGQVIAFESQIHRHKTRERIWISENAHAVFDSQGRVRWYEGTVEEITDRVRERQALREQGELWKRALENTGDGVWDWHVLDGTEVLSPAGAALFGYRPDELEQKPETLDALTHPDDVPEMDQARQAHFSGRTPVYVNEHRVRCKDGSWKWVLSRGVVMSRDAAGRPIRMIGTHTDITERKQAEALRRERDLAAAADQAKSQFLSRVSHELRTPLNAILGFAQLLQTGEGRTPPQTRQLYLEHLLTSGRHLLGVVNDVLDLASLQSGELRLSSAATPLQSLLAEVRAMLAPAAEAAEVQLFDDTEAHADFTAWCDAQRVRQILVNLVGNAVRYNHPQGWVRISRHQEPGSGGKAERILVRVADSGQGLDPAQLARLFQPFDRLGAQRGPVAGTGLGLAVSRQLARAMGGEIQVTSQPGDGSVFTLVLPAWPATDAAESTSKA